MSQDLEDRTSRLTEREMLHLTSFHKEREHLLTLQALKELATLRAEVARLTAAEETLKLLVGTYPQRMMMRPHIKRAKEILKGHAQMTDDELDALLRRYRKWKGYAPLTAEEAEEAFKNAEPKPISDEEIDAIVQRVTSQSEE